MNKHAIKLAAFQLLAHAGLIYGFFNFSLYDWLAVLAVYFVTGCVGMSVTFHRLLSHNSFKTTRFFETLGTLVGSYGLVGSSIAWVNNHRAHHRYTDTERDPHSPKFLGYFRVQWLSMFSSSKTLRYVRGIRKDSLHVGLHQNYFQLHIAILLGWIAFFGIHAACVYYLAPAAMLWNAGSFINTICHSWFGYRNYDIPDSSKNNLLLGVCMWGEGYHNNHHADPNNCEYGRKWYEVDISLWIINLIRVK